MRKLLLATAVAMGASLAGLGTSQAQVTTIPTLLPGTSPFGGPTVAPGSVIVRLGGRIEFFGFEGADSGDRITVPTATTAYPTAGTFKQQNYSFNDYYRIYPSVDGVAANGLQYGGFVEVRHENNYGVSTNDGNASSSISGNDRVRGTLYVRREYVYLGSPSFGTLRMGSTDGPSSLFETGSFENFNDGAWNGDVPNVFSGNTQQAPLFPDVGNLYTTTKLVYISPTFAGFTFGAAFEPTPSGVNDYGGANQSALVSTTTGGVTTYSFAQTTGCAAASPGCDRLSSSSASVTRRRNLVDIGARYVGTFGPVGVAADLDWIGSQHIGASANAAGVAPATRYSGLNVGNGGATVTIAGVTVGGLITGGKVNGQWSLAPVGAEKAIWALGGVSYSIGPVIVGASFYQYDSPGTSAPKVAGVGQSRARGFAAGGTYTLAPGMALFVSYLNGNIKENGVDLLGTGAASRQVNANGIGIGSFIRW